MGVLLWNFVLFLEGVRIIVGVFVIELLWSTFCEGDGPSCREAGAAPPVPSPGRGTTAGTRDPGAEGPAPLLARGVGRRRPDGLLRRGGQPKPPRKALPAEAAEEAEKQAETGSTPGQISGSSTTWPHRSREDQYHDGGGARWPLRVCPPIESKLIARARKNPAYIYLRVIHGLDLGSALFARQGQVNALAAGITPAPGLRASAAPGALTTLGPSCVQQLYPLCAALAAAWVPSC